MKHARSLSANEILELIFIHLTEVSSLRNHDDIISVLANMGRALTSSDRCTVWVISDDKKKIWTQVAHGMDPIEIPIDSGIVGSAIMNEEKIILEDVYEDPRFNPDIDKQTGYVTKSMMVIPMFNAQERAIMDTHAELGYNMTNSSERPLLKAASIVAYEHHEKWDGTGYPRGSSGEDIHIYGRITAIADVFDALGSDRVYKKAWNDEKILNLFREERGKHFDPALIDMFFENIDAIFEVRETFKDEYIEEPKQEIYTGNSIKILGAYGTKAKGFGTSSFSLNETNVIDAGNLLAGLGSQASKIQNIWITHSHLDHISDIAYVIDNYFDDFKGSINIHALPQTIETLQKHFLNDLVWPDFSKIKLSNSKEMCVSYIAIELDKEYKLSDKESIKAFKTDHTVPSCGYIYKSFIWCKDFTIMLLSYRFYTCKFRQP